MIKAQALLKNAEAELAKAVNWRPTVIGSTSVLTQVTAPTTPTATTTTTAPTSPTSPTTPTSP